MGMGCHCPDTIQGKAAEAIAYGVLYPGRKEAGYSGIRSMSTTLKDTSRQPKEEAPTKRPDTRLLRRRSRHTRNRVRSTSTDPLPSQISFLHGVLKGYSPKRVLQFEEVAVFHPWAIFRFGAVLFAVEQEW